MYRFWLLVVPVAASACALAVDRPKPVPRSLAPSQTVREDFVTYRVRTTSVGMGVLRAGQGSQFRLAGDVRAVIERELSGAREVADPSIPERGYFLSMQLVEQNPGFLSALWITGSLTALFCAIPYSAQTRYTLEVEVFRDGQLAKKYRYENHFREWCISVVYFLLPRFRNTVPDDSQDASSVPDTMIGNIMNTFLDDFSRDFLQEGRGR